MTDDISFPQPGSPQPGSPPSDGGLPLGQFDVVAAVLDGVASEAESSMVASSPALDALLDDLRADRASIGAIDVPPATRTAALAAAMAVFDGLQLAAGTAEVAAERVGPDAASAASSPVTAPSASSKGNASNVVRFGRRQRQYRAVLGAAAAVAVLFGGVVMVRHLDGLGGDDAETTSFEVPASVDENGRSIEAASTMGDAATGFADQSAADTMADTMPATEMPATGDTATGATAQTEMTPVDSGAIIDSIDGGAAVLDRVDDEASLRAWAVARPTPKSVALSTCIDERGGEQVELGTVLHLGTLAVVMRTVDSGALQVLELSTCATLLEATP